MSQIQSPPTKHIAVPQWYTSTMINAVQRAKSKKNKLRPDAMEYGKGHIGRSDGWGGTERGRERKSAWSSRGGNQHKEKAVLINHFYWISVVGLQHIALESLD